MAIAEADDTDEAVVLMEDNCRLRHRIAELEGGLCDRVQAEQCGAQPDTVMQAHKPQCRMCVPDTSSEEPINGLLSFSS